MISSTEALDLFRSDDLIGIGMAADSLRKKFHPEGIVSYIIDRNINYTNFCTEYCSFCAFYRPMGHPEGYVHDKETIFAKIQETIDLGGTGVLMQGGLHPDLKIEWYEDLLSSIKQRFTIHLHCFSAPEITNIADVSGLTVRDTIARLRDAGLDSIPGGGAEILDDGVRYRISRLKCSTAEWIDVHRTAHALGMRTTATMMFGCGETLEQRMHHLEIVREIQEDTGGFTALSPGPSSAKILRSAASCMKRPPPSNTSRTWRFRASISTTSRTYSPPGSRRGSRPANSACASAATTWAAS